MDNYIWVLVKDGMPVKWQKWVFPHSPLPIGLPIQNEDGTWYFVKEDEKNVHDTETCTEKPKDECISKEGYEACLRHIESRLDLIYQDLYRKDQESDPIRAHFFLGRLMSEVEIMIQKDWVPE